MYFSWSAGSSFTPARNFCALAENLIAGFIFSSNTYSKGVFHGRHGLRLALCEVVMSCREILISASDSHCILMNEIKATSYRKSLLCPRMAKLEQEFMVPKAQPTHAGAWIQWRNIRSPPFCGKKPLASQVPHGLGSICPNSTWLTTQLTLFPSLSHFPTPMAVSWTHLPGTILSDSLYLQIGLRGPNKGKAWLFGSLKTALLFFSKQQLLCISFQI